MNNQLGNILKKSLYILILVLKISLLESQISYNSYCDSLIDSFDVEYFQSIKPNANKWRDYENNGEKLKADSVKEVILSQLNFHKNNYLKSCDITNYKYCDIFVYSYSYLIYTLFPEKRPEIMNDLESILAKSKVQKNDSTFAFISNIKALFHLRNNEFKQMKQHLEEALHVLNNSESHFQISYRLRLNYALYYIYMNLPEEVINLTLFNDSIAIANNIPNKDYYKTNFYYMIDGYLKLNDFDQMLSTINKLKKFCDENINEPGFECYYEENLFYYYIEKGEYKSADSIYNNKLKIDLSPTDYETRLYYINLLNHFKKFEESKQEIHNLDHTFNLYKLPKTHVFRLSLLRKKLELSIFTKDDDLTTQTLKEISFAFKSNIYNVFNEDPNFQLKILKPMQKMSWYLLSKFKNSTNPDINSSLFELNTICKKLNPEFFSKRNEILSTEINDEDISSLLEEIKFKTNKLAVTIYDENINQKNKAVLMDSILNLEQKMQSLIIKDVNYSVPDISVAKIQNMLKDDEVYIEFVELVLNDNSQENLCLFLISKNEIHVKHLQPFENQIQSKINFINNQVQNEKMFNYLIAPIYQLIKDKSKFFIISDGYINRVPIEILSENGSRNKSLLNKSLLTDLNLNSS